MDIFCDIMKLAGSLICHQLPERSIYAEGMPLPLCARDTGIYLGVFTVVLFSMLFRRMGSDRQPSLPYAILLCLMMVPMMVDGTGSYLGLYITNNTARLFTGVFFGMPLGMFLIPIAHFKISGINKKRFLNNPLELAGIVAAGAMLCLAVLKCSIPWTVTSAVIIGSMLFLIGRVIYTLICLAWKGNGSLIFIKTAGAMTCVLFVMYLLSNHVFRAIESYFTGALR